MDSNDSFHIVALGASAGGLNALEQFFDAMQPDSGMAFVVIQHLSPDFKSLMDDLLARHTAMPIRQATEDLMLEPDTIYLSPPRFQMGLESGRITLKQKPPGVPVELAIDIFFRSLAADIGERAVGIVLSGTGSDGSRGIRAIRDAGGLVIVQSPDSAQFDGMPRNAIASGCYDFQLPPERIPRLLIEYDKDPASVRSRVSHTVEVFPEDGEFAEIFALLRRGFNVDFSKYKTTTVGRRIRRRVELRFLSSVEDYVAILTGDPEELDALYRDLLIGVTEFFRDPETFEHLANNIVPELIASSQSTEELRIWSACCATGEEAYSLAIIFAEAAEIAGYMGKITIFATDVHKRSIETASACLYGRDRLTNVSTERLARFFRQEMDDTWRLSQDIRRMVVFAPHNVITDPPFTKTDLVCCRNMLIYLEPEVQDRVIATFHYALKVSGILFLGSSEGLGSFAAEFETLDSHHKMFRKKRELRLPLDFQATQSPTRFQVAVRSAQTQTRSVSLDRQLLKDYDLLLDRYIPSGILVDENRQVLHFFGDLKLYLSPITGRADKNLLSILVEELHVAVSTTLQRAIRDRASALLSGVLLLSDDGMTIKVTVAVEPLYDDRVKMTHFFISFRSEEFRPLPSVPINSEEIFSTFEEESLYRQHINDLELDLKLTRENLQAANEELQTSNEELQATNEELLASNEELQSTNEELHSVNEELFTVNSEFERKNAELKNLNYDHENLLSSIDVGTVFVDRRLCIRKFNAAVSGFFRLLPHDIGRPIEHIAYHLTDQSRLMDDIRKVLSTGSVLEKEDVTPSGSRHILIRILPFKTDVGAVEGVVVLFTDITRIKETELTVQCLNEELKERYAELGQKYENKKSDVERIRAELRLKEEDILEIQHITSMAAFKWDMDNDEIALSDSFLQFFPGLKTSAVFNSESFLQLVHPDDRDLMRETVSLLASGERRQFEVRMKLPDEAVLHVLCSLRRHSDQEEAPGMLVGNIHDITERKLAQQRLQESEELLRESQKMEAIGILAGGIAHDFNNILQVITGYTSLLKMTPGLTSGMDDNLNSVLHACSRATELTQGLLAYGRKQTLSMKQGNLVDILNDAVRFLHRIIGENFELLIEHKSAVLPVRADISQMHQVFANLITNARDAMPSGGRLTICTGLKELDHSTATELGAKMGNYAFIQFNDTGMGISEDIVSRIFEPFFTTKGVGKGTGLGLSIVYGIVKQHDGFIQCRSKIGDGTEFLIIFPLTEKDDNMFISNTDTIEPANGTETILLVEDEPAVREVSRLILASKGYNVIEAANGDEALEYFNQNNQAIDLVITDVVMPGKSGVDTCNEIRAIRPDLPVLFVSGYPMRNMNIDVSELNTGDFIQKPLEPNVLLCKIRSMLDRRESCDK